MNGDLWRVQFVSSQDDVLIDRTGKRTLAVSDYSTMTISIANNLHGELLNRVFIHELGHCVMFSYGLLPELHRMVKKRYWWMQRNLYAIFWQTTDSLLLAQPEMFWETNLHTFRLLEWKG